MDTPTLDTSRLKFRPITETDIDFIYTLFRRPETNKYSTYDDLKSREEAVKMYEEYLKPGFPTHFRCAVCLGEAGEPIGTIGFYGYAETHKRAVIGYDLLAEYWGRGYTSEAVQAIIEYGFNILGLNRIEATVDPENAASVRVLEKNGFKYEGTLRKRFYYREKWRDELFYGLLKEEWR